jgi:hypothetical protein
MVHSAIGSPPGYTVGDTIFLWGNPSTRLINHEQGHLPQYDWLGDLFWPAYGLGAAIAAPSCIQDLGMECVHDRNFMEWWADR